MLRKTSKAADPRLGTFLRKVIVNFPNIYFSKEAKMITGKLRSAAFYHELATKRI